MAHCNNQMTDFVPIPPVGLNGSIYVKAKDTAHTGVGGGLACVSNGANVACSYRESIDALVYYDANGNVLWTSGTLLDTNTHIRSTRISRCCWVTAMARSSRLSGPICTPSRQAWQ